MLQRLNGRPGHYALLLLVGALLYLPNLGGPSLWDIDEGNNAEAAREMLEADNWVVPSFNYKLRVDKPALLYWLQLAGYQVFGVGEFAARLPSALAALVTLLLLYELGRSLFGATAGLLAGLVLASSTAFCVAAHFANPDALLNGCTVLTLFFFWRHYRRPRWLGFVPMGAAMGLGMLAKGPVAVVLPLAATTLFLLWSRQLQRLRNGRLLLGVVVFILVMVPWYAWVGADTKAEFLRGFFLDHNVGRYGHPMENHAGPFYYYALVLPLGFLPWSIFLGPTVWHGLQALRRAGPRPDTDEARVDPRAAPRLLWCWIGVYLLFFSLAATKLPNYVLPAYAPLALLTGWWLDRWCRGALALPAWVVPVSLTCLALLGVGTTVAVLMAGGVMRAPGWLRGTVPDPGPWALLGVVLVLGAVAAGWCLWRGRRPAVVGLVAGVSVLFLGVLAAGGSDVLERAKAPRSLVEALRAAQTEPEIRVGCYQYFQPSLVFYCQREVRPLGSTRQVREFLNMPIPVYLFVPAAVWEQERAQLPTGRILARRRDLYRDCDVVVVTNR